jgi:hypothetical protein
MTYEESIRVLLNGTTGMNVRVVTENTKISTRILLRFFHREEGIPQATIDKLAWFVWERLNVHVLLSVEERNNGTSGQIELTPNEPRKSKDDKKDAARQAI